MPRRLEVFIKNGFPDTIGEENRRLVREELGIKPELCHFIEAYNIDAGLSDEEMKKLGEEVFADSIIQAFSFKAHAFENLWRIEIGFLPGVTDNMAHTARQAIKDALGKDVEVYYSRMVALSGVEEKQLESIAGIFHNPLIEKYLIHAPLSQVKPYLPKVAITHALEVEKISLHMNEERLQSLAKQRLLALSKEEFRAIKSYFRDPEVIEERKTYGLDARVTDVEIECIAQTWSEHCKHKIFNSFITYHDEDNKRHGINSLFKTFIKGATETIKKPYVVSVFKDNGGIIKFDHNYDIAIKVETHNAPSALDPYGGALTGVLGVQRDIMGTGMGAMPIANVDMLCFGYLDEKEVPRGVLHPRRIFDGVIKGIEHGGNKMGIPTVNGSITFEKSFVARPLVYCGTMGMMPSEISGRKTAEKSVKPGQLAVMVGGRIGKDGIHGATFSSLALEESVPQSVVQIGDPITQKKMFDFILEARDALLYEAITDNGAGGISSSIGELAQFSNGCEIYLDKCPLKYPGLQPWEILVSESQERMTLVVDKSKYAELEKLAKKHDVEISAVGKFTNSGRFHALYGTNTVAYMGIDFLHNGVPQMKLHARWKKKQFEEPVINETSPSKILRMLLRSPNIASKESVIRRYDHEVKGMSVVKPIMPSPNDAAVLKPLYDGDGGIVISHGICPKYVQDSYAMAALAFDEAVRNALSVGAKFGYLACLDNFSWPDPISSEKNLDGEYKLAQLVRSCISLYDFTTAYGIPMISGKDSMKNDYAIGDEKYSIAPTLLVTVLGKIDNVRKAVTSDFKAPGDAIYVLGTTREELGGSEYYKLFNGVGNNNPVVRPQENLPLYRALSQAMEEGVIASCHDVSDGGLAVALAECTIGVQFGADLDVALVQKETDKEDAILFSENPGRFIVSVSEKNIAEFEKIMHGKAFSKVGRVRGDKRCIIRRGEQILVNESVEDLKVEWDSFTGGKVELKPEQKL